MQSAPQFEKLESEATAPKPYARPTLIKGPVLTTVTAAKSISGPIGSDNRNPCWVARAAFGEGDVRWIIFRDWLVNDAPAWFRRLYLRHGEAVGGWMATRPAARWVVRALMTPAINRKLFK